MIGLLSNRAKEKEIIKATEAWALTKKYDKYAEQLAQIEVLIQNEAEHGGSYTWWYCENMGKYEQKNWQKDWKSLAMLLPQVIM